MLMETSCRNMALKEIRDGEESHLVVDKHARFFLPKRPALDISAYTMTTNLMREASCQLNAAL